MAAQVLAEVACVAEQHGTPLLVIGATARDILSQAVTGAPPGRATADVDVAVAVPTWAAFHGLTSRLVRVGRHPHRFAVAGVPVDLVPFGGLESGSGVVAWADGGRMSTLGLREADRRSLTAALPGGLTVREPSIAGLTALKLRAWADRRLATRRDAVDLQTIIGWYGIGTALDALYEQDTHLLAAHDFDPGPASARRLGRHTADVLGGAAPQVAAVLDEDGRGRLVADMPRSALDWAPLVEALARGLRETGAADGQGAVHEVPATP